MIDSRLTVELSFEAEGEPRLSAMVRRDRTLQFARSEVLHPPYTPAGIGAAVGALVRAWLAPELAQDALQAFEATFVSLTDPL